ncbi:peptide chain release factor N(5)-glutamine methyltransferase [Candidatus Uhrbacteria bacterium]|nr:peptide chain release factor N(5)-glutamine methyltransferase [Candidatus Uhrbacteria bacterium]
MTIKESLKLAKGEFEVAGIPSALLDAEVLLAHALSCDRAHVLAHCDQMLTPEQEKTYMLYVRERSARKPVAYITGRKQFYGLDFLVNKYTLIPRPETEQLVQEVIDYCGRNPHAQSIIELGVGSGCVVLSILKNIEHITYAFAIDRVKRALEIAKANAQALGLETRISFKRSDMWKQVPKEYTFDIVVANPPYLSAKECAQARKDCPEIAYEPQIALLGGMDGLLFFESLFQRAHRHLRPGGTIFLEIGTHQKDAIETLAKKYLPKADILFRTDECGNVRIAIITLAGKNHAVITEN